MARLQTLKPSIQTLRATVKTAAPVDRIRGTTWQRIRERVLRANPLCVSCEAAGRVTVAREVDHITPLCVGGSNALANLQGLCVACHRVKTDEEAGGRAGGV